MYSLHLAFIISLLANGFARAEAVSAIYLQKKSVAKRAYASILGIKTNTDGFKINGVNSPSVVAQAELLGEMLNESEVDLKDVTYVEAHGTGTQAGDSAEFHAVQSVFLPSLEGRKTPLYLGSVKSNMGHGEGSSGICSLAKIVIMCQEGAIPANLHFKTPQYGMNALRTGSMQVCKRTSTASFIITK